MPDFYVAALRYRVKPCDGVEYENPPPIEVDDPLFHMILDSGALTFTMKDHFATATEAKAALAPFLRAWEVAQYVRCGRKEMDVTYEKADIVDRDPPTDGSQYVFLEAVGCIAMAGEVKGIVCKPEYPAPILHFAATPLVEILLNAYKEFGEGRWRRLDMGYFIYTVLRSYETSPEATLHQVAARYNIDPAVLRKLRELTSTRGDATTARKYPPKCPLSPKEEEWIDAAVRFLIRRAGEVDAGASTARMAMADLPEL